MLVETLNSVQQKATRHEAKIDNQISYNITFSINRPYLLFCMVTLYSLLKNNSKYYFNIYILHNNCLKEDEISKITKQHPLNQYNNFTIHLVDVSHLTELQELKEIEYWEKEIYFKVFLPDLLPQVDKILHLDVDVIVRGDIKEFLETDMRDHLFLGEKDIQGHDKYICVGVLILNLKQMRKESITQKMFEVMKKEKVIEQEAVNRYYDRLLVAKSKDIYIVVKDIKELNDVRIVHYTTCKPWNLVQMKVLRKFKSRYISDYYVYYQEFVEKRYKYNFKIYYVLLRAGLPAFYSILRRILNLYQKKTKKKKTIPKFVVNKLYKYSFIKKQ